MSDKEVNAWYDYVIVGSGAGGSILAERLSRDPSTQVLVLEAGGTDRSLLHLVPKGVYFTMTNPKFTTTYTTEPFGDGNRDVWHRGRIIGGSTTINGMIWNRGWAPAYDAWEEAGNTGWNWDRFVDAFAALESSQLGANAFRGGKGPVPITVASPRERVSDALIAALGKNHVTFTDDMNSSGDERVGYVASSIGRGLRMSAARAFLYGARRRRNVTVLDRTEADRIIFEGTTATGVEATRRGQTVRFGARHEVLICAGSLESPLLLERSGIGDPHVLNTAGVRMVAPSPKVGGNLREHRSIAFVLKLKGEVGYNRQVNSLLKQGWTGFKYLFSRTGVMAFGGYNVVAMYKSDPASPQPDTQSFFTPASVSGVDSKTGRMAVDRHAGGMFLTYPMYPTSAGSIHITGPTTKDKPRIVTNYLTTNHDRSLTAKMVTKAREILATAPFGQFVEAEMAPGEALQREEDAVNYALGAGGGPGYHALGTCAIGPNEDDVVDDRLRVRGTSQLRVVDASVFPAMPSGNNSAPTQAMAWIAADLILKDAH